MVVWYPKKTGQKKKNLLTSCQAIACCDNVFEPDAGTTKEIQAETFTEKV
jgi:hypothetical protein